MNLSSKLAPILLVLAIASQPLRSENGFPAHYLVLSVDAEGDVTPMFHRRVELAAALRSRTEAEIEVLRREVSRDEDRVEVRLLDRKGEIVFHDVVQVPLWIRGEFHGDRAAGGWAIEEHSFPLEPRVFVVRVPTTGELLSLASVGSNDRTLLRTVAFDLEDLESRADLLPTAAPPEAGKPVVAGVATGSPGNRVDLLILGDGYTAAQAAKFNSDVASLEQTFFNLTPYSQYKNYVNRAQLFMASAQSGADHPPYNPSCSGDNPSCCADPDAQFDPLAGTYVNTAFGGRFCAFNIHRLAVVNTSAVYAAAAAYPDWDKILVLLNDSTYGGSGGGISVVSTNQFAVDVARHEYGHSFTGLADEYESSYPGFPGCSDAPGSFSPCEANVTNQTSRAQIKWSPWISAATPVPTPEGNPIYANVAGLFQGARYLTTGMYRHSDTECLMNYLGKPFGEVCGQEYILKLYRGGWGTPWDGIDPIEPGSEIPPEGSYQALTGMTFSAALLGPVGGPLPAVAWKVNGTTVPGATGASYSFRSAVAGTYQVTLEVRDATTLVHPSMAGTSLQSSRAWSITTAPSAPLDFYTLPPCRVLDTRDPNGAYGGPALGAFAERSFVLASRCGVPANARAVSVNLTATQSTQAGYLTTYPGGSAPQVTSNLTFVAGQTRSNNAILPLALNGSGTLVLRSGTGGPVHAVLDINGYFF